MGEEDNLSNFVTELCKVQEKQVHASDGAIIHNEFDRRAFERMWGQEWALSKQAEQLFGKFVRLEDAAAFQEPPDLHVNFNNVVVGVEHTQLIDSHAICKGRKLVKQGRTLSQARSELFMETQWDSARIVNKLYEVIQNKSSRYEARRIKIDVLLITSAEPWLLPEIVKSSVINFEPPPQSVFSSIFLMLAYDPNLGSYPIFQLE